VPPRVEYELTPLGETLKAPIAAISEWAEQHLDEIMLARMAHDAASGRE
jgi:DNA-binding HxlR family transcriptional regulator